MTSSVDFNVDRFDPGQVKLLEEKCILVDADDLVVGMDTKKNCHLNVNIQKGLLHRAFSVFLFNTNNQLLLQQRSKLKITFPGYWTNSCCSHPLHTPAELDPENAKGVKRAAQRRMNIELGIQPHEIPYEKMEYLTRIIYQAESDDIWGEHEIDYILLIKADVNITPNPSEVDAIRWVDQRELRTLIKSANEQMDGVKITPWFKLVCDKFLTRWWDNVDKLTPLADHRLIHSALK